LGPDHLTTATYLNNLAILYKNQGKYDEAEPLESHQNPNNRVKQNQFCCANKLNFVEASKKGFCLKFVTKTLTTKCCATFCN
jgi:hypothetical protein